MKSKTAFTLVELLVVVAIIVALIAILLPSMGRAVEAAQIAVCQSNQHQIAITGLTWAADNAGAIPRADSNSAPHRSYAMAFGSNRYVKDYPTHWGNVYARGYLPTGEVFYCPSASNQPGHDYNFYHGSIGGAPEDWKTAPSPSGAEIARSTYFVNPYRIARLASPNQPDVPVTAPLSPDRQFMVITRVHHTDSFYHTLPVWNAAMFDGSTRSFESEEVRDRITNYVSGGTLPGNSWVIFEELVDLLVQ